MCDAQERRYRSPRGMKPRCLIGNWYDRVYVFDYAGSWGPVRKTEAFWLCICDCPDRTIFVVRGKSLTQGKTRSCGCLKRELSRERRTQLRHGGTNTPEFKAWASMKHRCKGTSNPRLDRRYKDRGIQPCEGFRLHFEHFRDVMGEKPSPRHSIDRIDNDRGYDCGRCDDCRSRGATLNCRWATAKEQMRNRCSTVWLEFRGQRLSLPDACELAGLPQGTVRQRLRAGWPVDAALTLPRGAHYYRRGEGPYAGKLPPLWYSS